MDDPGGARRHGGAVSGAAVLGAPLIHDFCRHLPERPADPLGEDRAAAGPAAAEADFVLCPLQPPAASRRADHLQKACDIVMRHQSPDTVCGTGAQHRPGGPGRAR